MFTNDQALVFLAMLALVIITWPRMAKSLGRVLSIHSEALTVCYYHMWRGVCIYFKCWSDAYYAFSREERMSQAILAKSKEKVHTMGMNEV